MSVAPGFERTWELLFVIICYTISMFSFLSNKGRSESIVVFDVNAESVGAAVVLSDRGVTPRVVYTSREYFFHEKSAPRDARHVIDSMRDAFRRTENFLAKNILSHPIFRSYAPSKTHFVFSAPWLESKIQTMKIERRDKITITKKNLAALIEKEGEIFRTELSRARGVSETSFIVVKNRITSIKLDGSETKKPYGKKAKLLEITLSMGALPTEIRDIVSFPSEKRPSRERIPFLRFRRLRPPLFAT